MDSAATKKEPRLPKIENNYGNKSQMEKQSFHDSGRKQVHSTSQGTPALPSAMLQPREQPPTTPGRGASIDSAETLLRYRSVSVQ